MGRLTIFNRKINLASDDLYFGAAYAFLLHLIWLTSIAISYAFIRQDCQLALSLQYYALLLLILLSTSLPLDACILVLSMMGTVANKGPRRYVGLLVHVGLTLGAAELILHMCGLYVAFGPNKLKPDLEGCSIPLPVSTIRLVQMVAIWGFSAQGVWYIILVFFFYGSNAKGRSVNSLEKSVRVWQRRLEFCCNGRADAAQADSKDLLKQLASELAEYFHDVDWAPSDLALGLILLKREQKLVTEIRQARRLILEQPAGFSIPTLESSDMLVELARANQEDVQRREERAVLMRGWIAAARSNSARSSDTSTSNNIVQSSNTGLPSLPPPLLLRASRSDSPSRQSFVGSPHSQSHSQSQSQAHQWRRLSITASPLLDQQYQRQQALQKTSPLVSSIDPSTPTPTPTPEEFLAANIPTGTENSTNLIIRQGDTNNINNNSNNPHDQFQSPDATEWAAIMNSPSLSPGALRVLDLSRKVDQMDVAERQMISEGQAQSLSDSQDLPSENLDVSVSQKNFGTTSSPLSSPKNTSTSSPPSPENIATSLSPPSPENLTTSSSPPTSLVEDSHVIVAVGEASIKEPTQPVSLHITPSIVSEGLSEVNPSSLYPLLIATQPLPPLADASPTTPGPSSPVSPTSSASSSPTKRNNRMSKFLGSRQSIPMMRKRDMDQKQEQQSDTPQLLKSFSPHGSAPVLTPLGNNLQNQPGSKFRPWWSRKKAQNGAPQTTQEKKQDGVGDTRRN